VALVLGALLATAAIHFSADGDSGGQPSETAGSRALAAESSQRSLPDPDLAASTELPANRRSMSARETERVPVEPSPSEEEPPQVDPFEVPTEQALEEKYANFKGLEIVGAFKGFEGVYVKLAQPFLDRKLAEGDYVVEFKRHGEEFGSSVTRDMWPGDVGPTEKVRIVSLGDGLLEVQKATVYPSEFPMLTALHAERAWLRKKAGAYEAEHPGEF
jgi:hypothetical protein